MMKFHVGETIEIIYTGDIEFKLRRVAPEKYHETIAEVGRDHDIDTLKKKIETLEEKLEALTAYVDEIASHVE